MNSRANIQQKEPRLFGDIYPVKKTGYQIYLKQPVFLRKYICALWVNIAQVIVVCNVVSDTYLDNID